jgi:mannose-1-phosphate guanylyltransferase
MTPNLDFRPIILAGGSGTRFWPRSRRWRAKQLLVLEGERSMIQSTVDRLGSLAKEHEAWVITNDLLSQEICKQLNALVPERVICEPAARNTAPAAGLAAFLIEKTAPEAVLGIFPADHVITDEEKFRSVIAQGISLAAEGENMVVLGVTPTHPETGYGYIETGDHLKDGVMRVRRFTEKPNREKADEFVRAGNYFWNSGIFLWSARTLANAIREHLSETAPLLQQIADAYGTPRFAEVFREVYPKCENISIDYAVLEPRSTKGEHNSNLYCLRAEFGWNDLGSWAALYDHQLARGRADTHGNVAEGKNHLAIDARNNYVYSPGKYIALIGVEDMVVVETEDAILVTTRERSQDVRRVVSELSGKNDALI